jgi:t-SNARE complex subunit (syntaxin)
MRMFYTRETYLSSDQPLFGQLENLEIKTTQGPDHITQEVVRNQLKDIVSECREICDYLRKIRQARNKFLAHKVCFCIFVVLYLSSL